MRTPVRNATTSTEEMWNRKYCCMRVEDVYTKKRIDVEGTIIGRRKKSRLNGRHYPMNGRVVKNMYVEQTYLKNVKPPNTTGSPGSPGKNKNKMVCKAFLSRNNAAVVLLWMQVITAAKGTLEISTLLCLSETLPLIKPCKWIPHPGPSLF